ncbi:MAG TPA: class I SAM-dependent methyltransferase [Polyangiaceae bacterium]|nr:class I SAM-dependent methyltransferase [Polyangiaceae bacterium]
MDAGWISESAPWGRAALTAYAMGQLGPDMALLQVLMAAPSAAEAMELLEKALLLARGSAEPSALGRLEQLCTLAREQGRAWPILARTLELVDQGDAAGQAMAGPDATSRLARIANGFDRAAELCPEASVALYSFGDGSRLAAATAELAERLRDWGLLGREWAYLDIGCGIGRLEQALAPAVRSIVGIDISRKMIELARARCAGLPNVAFQVANGRDLRAFAAGSLDVVLAVDSFPYLVRCGVTLVTRQLSEVARVLKPGGQLAIFNFSYRNDPDADREELASYAADLGLTMLRSGARGLRTWDGAGYQLIK